MTQQKLVLKIQLTGLMHRGYCYAPRHKVAFIGNEFKWRRTRAERSQPKNHEALKDNNALC